MYKCPLLEELGDPLWVSGLLTRRICKQTQKDAQGTFYWNIREKQGWEAANLRSCQEKGVEEK